MRNIQNTATKSLMMRSAFFASFLWAGLASAGVKIVVYPAIPLQGHASAKASSEYTRSVIEAFKDEKDFEVVAGVIPSENAEGDRLPAGTKKIHRRGLGAIRAARKFSKKLKTNQAIQSLESGIKDIEASIIHLQKFTTLTSAYILLAESYYRRGKQQAGVNALENAARLNPEIEVDASQYPPVFVAALDQAKGRILRRDKGTVAIESPGARAEVYFNGRAAGPAPLKVENVPPGEHFVVLKGAESFAATVKVAENETVRINKRASEENVGGSISAKLSQNILDKSMRARFQRWARSQGGDYVVVMAMSDGAGVYAVGSYLGHARNGRWVALPETVPDVDMLSAAIEGYTLVRATKSFVGNMRDEVGETQVEMISGARPGRAGNGRRAAVARNTWGVFEFVKKGGRAPAVAVVAIPTTSPQPSASQKRPVGSNPNSPRPKVSSRGPVTRSSAGPRRSVDPAATRRGPLVSGETGPKVIEIEQPTRVVDDERAREAVALPLSTPLNLDEELEKKDGVHKKWWFWTLVVVAAAGAGVGTYYAVDSAQRANTLEVFAAW